MSTLAQFIKKNWNTKKVCKMPSKLLGSEQFTSLCSSHTKALSTTSHLFCLN